MFHIYVSYLCFIFMFQSGKDIKNLVGNSVSTPLKTLYSSGKDSSDGLAKILSGITFLEKTYREPSADVYSLPSLY